MTHSSQPSVKTPKWLKEWLKQNSIHASEGFKTLMKHFPTEQRVSMAVVDVSDKALARAGAERNFNWNRLLPREQEQVIDDFHKTIEALLVAGAIMVRPAGNQNQHKVDANVATHALKTLPKFFDKVAEGTKTAELRKNDRGFKVGDYVKLIRSDGSSKPASITRRISHIVEGGQYGLAQDFCMLSLADIDEVQP